MTSTKIGDVAELTKLESKLGEVTGVAMAAQAAIKKATKFPEADDFAADLRG